MATKTNKELMQERAEQADLLIKDLGAPAVTGEESSTDPNTSAADTTQPPTTEVSEAPPIGEAATDPAPQGVVVTAEELAALKAKADSLTKDLDKANSRYSTLQGMITAKDNDNRVLRAMLADLSAAAPPAPPAAPAAGVSDAVTDKDIEDFGEDLINLITRVVKREVAPLMQDVAYRVDSVANVASTTAQTQFEARLLTLVPDWESINDDPQFIAWLGTYKRDALNAAYLARDLLGTAEFFTDYLSLTASQAPPAPVADPAVPAVPVATPEPVQTPAQKLEALAAPGKGKVAPPPGDSPSGKIWTAADVTELYAAYRTRSITADEFNKQEADLFKAQQDGRYKP